MNASTVSSPYIHYVLELQTAGLDVRLLLNDVEIVRGSAGDRKAVQKKINGWLVEGSNELKLLAAVPPETGTGILDLKCLVFRGPAGRQPEESEALARYAERERAKLPAGEMQPVWTTSFAADPFYGPWLWERGLQINLGDESKTQCMKLILKVVQALNDRNDQELSNMVLVIMDEASLAYNVKRKLLEDQLPAWIASWQPLALEKVNFEEYSFSLAANQRLIRIERKDGFPVFNLDPKTPRPGPRSVYIAKLGESGWTLVRSE